MQNLKINLQHLHYFWSVASYGSITRASEALYLTPQTISAQLRDLEVSFGKKLFRREGRNLVLSETGRMVFSYADEMFQIGLELQDLLADLSVHKLDADLSNSPINPSQNIRAYNHYLTAITESARTNLFYQADAS